MIDRVRRARARRTSASSCDLYHLAVNGDDVDAAIADARRPDRATCRSPTPPAAASPAPATSPSTASSADLDGRRLRRLGRPRVQAATTHRRELRLAAARAPLHSRLTRTDLTQGEPHMTHHRLHRPRHHGQPDGRPPGQGRPHGAGYNRTPGADRAAGRRRRPGAPSSIAEAVTDADVVVTMVPDSPDVAATCSPARTASSHNAKPGTLIIDFSSIRPDVTVELAEQAASSAASGCSTPRSPAARRAPRTPRCRSWSAATRPTSTPPSRSSRRSARPSCTSGRSGSGQTVKAANQLIVAGNIQLLAEAIVFLEAYGVDTEAALEVLGGGLAGSDGAGPEGQNMLDALASSPASGSTCTTRTWASSPPPPARPASSSRSARSSPS